MSLYRITEKASAFSIQGFASNRVTVELQPWTLSVTSDGYPEARCGFYGQDQLDRLIAARLLGEDDPAPDATNDVALASRLVRATTAIHTDVGRQRIRLLAQVDPAVHQVQLIALRLAGRIPSLAQTPALYREPYVLRDILNYRAAAIALAFLHSELCGGESQPSVEGLMAAMTNWRGLFSPDRRPYRSLDRTLMNLPADVAPELVCHLSKARLERPVVNPVELTMLLLYVSHALATGPYLDLDRFRIFHHATAAEIADAIQRIGHYTTRRLDPRRPEDLRLAVRFLCDYPEPFRGTLTGLVQRVLRWHERAHERAWVEQQTRWLGGYNQPVVPPPIALPAEIGVKFLATVGAIVEEGLHMRHCIATRAEAALHGGCFLFHIEHEGERASVEVSPKGEIADAQGPHNTDNGAVSWGATQLRAWGARLRIPEVSPAAAPVRTARRARAADPNQLALPF